MDGLERDRLFVAMTRPQMLFGVPYGYAVFNAVLTTELFLLFKSPAVLLLAVVVHAAGWIACLKDPHIFNLWLTRTRRCPRVPNHGVWRCNSYRP